MQLSKKQYLGLYKPLETIRKATSEHYPFVNPQDALLQRTDVDGFDIVNVLWRAHPVTRRLRSDGTFYRYSVYLGGLDGVDRHFILGMSPLLKRNISLYSSDSQAPQMTTIDEEGQVRFTNAGLDAKLNSISLAEQTGLNEITPQQIDTLGSALASFVELQQVEIKAALKSS